MPNKKKSASSSASPSIEWKKKSIKNENNKTHDNEIHESSFTHDGFKYQMTVIADYSFDNNIIMEGIINKIKLTPTNASSSGVARKIFHRNVCWSLNNYYYNRPSVAKMKREIKKVVSDIKEGFFVDPWSFDLNKLPAITTKSRTKDILRYKNNLIDSHRFQSESITLDQLKKIVDDYYSKIQKNKNDEFNSEVYIAQTNGYAELVLELYGLENDDDYRFRLSRIYSEDARKKHQIAEDKAKKEASEKALYEKLKNKFEEK